MRSLRGLQVGVVLLGLIVVPIGVVVVHDMGTGAGVLIVPVGASPSHVTVDARTGRAFVTNSSDSSLSVLDARSGTILRTVAVGAAPSALAVNAHTGRVFVVNAGSGTVSV